MKLISLVGYDAELYFANQFSSNIVMIAELWYGTIEKKTSMNRVEAG